MPENVKRQPAFYAARRPHSGSDRPCYGNRGGAGTRPDHGGPGHQSEEGVDYRRSLTARGLAEGFYLRAASDPSLPFLSHGSADQFHKTIHWTWHAYTDEKGHQFGKGGDSINNFCISTDRMQDKSCLSCHPGWGEETVAVNCLNCHGQKSINWGESFEDLAAFAGSDDPEEQAIADEIRGNIRAAVQAVVRPERQNCGGCHFKGGGGDGVKHGDLDTSLTKPNKALDVHMGIDGRNFQCTRCHTTTLHNIAGRVYTKPAASDRKSLIEDDLATKITCESCHSSTPHKSESKANDHTDKVACQSCHIPTFARVNPTKVSWDWSKAGKRKDGKPYKTEDAFGKHDYMSIKGQFKWAKNVKPEYFWYNGSISSITAKDPIDPSKVVAVSHPLGSREDKNARIFPFKVHHASSHTTRSTKPCSVPCFPDPTGTGRPSTGTGR